MNPPLDRTNLVKWGVVTSYGLLVVLFHVILIVSCTQQVGNDRDNQCEKNDGIVSYKLPTSQCDWNVGNRNPHNQHHRNEGNPPPVLFSRRDACDCVEDNQSSYQISHGVESQFYWRDCQHRWD